MAMLKLTRPDGTPINEWQEWTRPKKDYQWKEGRSAMELAKSWFRNDVLSPPQEFLPLLHSSPRLRGIVLTIGIPELVTTLPERGNGRNHDLALKGNTQNESVTICIEAKADEPFGNATVGEYWNSGILKRYRGISTRIPERVEFLVSMVDLVSNSIDSSPWKDIRYQLLTALCGTILQAKNDNSTLAVFVVHEFFSNETSTIKHVENHSELERFLSVLSGYQISIETGKLNGPFRFEGVDCMIGKIITELIR
jgi:hypothetical protein